MIRKTMALLTALTAAVPLALPCLAVQAECGQAACLSPEDFAGQELTGICITDLPEEGTFFLGSRQLREGDVLTAGQLEELTFSPRWTWEDRVAQVGYLPISPAGVEPQAVMTLNIRGRENQAPAAEDFALETYKNVPVEGRLKVKDPEGEAMTYAITRQSKRGTVTVNADGSFTYTPRENKVGVDSFVYTATDGQGQVSREATVTVTILKPSQAPQYTDTVGLDCRFAAEWMKNTGIFVGEQVDGNPCFHPDREVSRGEFTAMLVKALDLMEQESALEVELPEQTPQWLRPYLTAALRSGLAAGLPEGMEADPAAPITGAEAAVMVQNLLDLEAGTEEMEAVPAWAQSAVTAMAREGMALEANQPLTRAQAALLLYWAQKR